MIIGGTIRAEVIEADIEACNGVIHIIDAVLLPPVLARSTHAHFHNFHLHDSCTLHQLSEHYEVLLDYLLQYSNRHGQNMHL